MRACASNVERRAWLDSNDVREARIIIRWIERNANRVVLLHVDAPWVMPARGRPQQRFVVRDPDRARAADVERKP